MKTLERLSSALAAVFCGLSVALAAYAMHGASGHAREQLALAALFAFAHGLALIALHARHHRLCSLAKLLFVLGIVLFSGSLVAAAILGTATALAPFGGGLLMLGWGILALDFLRRH